MIPSIILIVSVLLYGTTGAFVCGRIVRYDPEWATASGIVVAFWPIALLVSFFYWIYRLGVGND